MVQSRAAVLRLYHGLGESGLTAGHPELAGIAPTAFPSFTSDARWCVRHRVRMFVCGAQLKTKSAEEPRPPRLAVLSTSDIQYGCEFGQIGPVN